MRYRLVEEHRGKHSVVALCRAMEVSSSAFYAWRHRSVSAREQANVALLVEVRAAHFESEGTYGSPRVHQHLLANGIVCGRHRVARLMRGAGIRGCQPKRFVVTTESQRSGWHAPNILKQRFESQRANQVWVGDITFVPTWEGWLYVAVVLDLYSRFVVGYATRHSLHRSVAIEALEMALRNRRPQPGLIHHSDRGCQYTSWDYQNLLGEHGLVTSMSRRGNCWDNAPVESFFATLKKELINRRPRQHRTREDARRDISRYIEIWYNRQRLHSSIGFLSPAKFEVQNNINLPSVA